MALSSHAGQDELGEPDESEHVRVEQLARRGERHLFDWVEIMLGRSYEDQICSISRTLEVIGERWTVLILRDVFLGLRRFGDLQQSLGIARNVLTDRLNWLVESGILERVRYQDHPIRYEYQLSAKGKDLLPVLLAMMHWGDRHQAGAAGRPRLTTHAGCGGDVVQQLTCTRCAETVTPDRLELLPGPALTAQA